MTFVLHLQPCPAALELTLTQCPVVADMENMFELFEKRPSIQVRLMLSVFVDEVPLIKRWCRRLTKYSSLLKGQLLPLRARRILTEQLAITGCT